MRHTAQTTSLKPWPHALINWSGNSFLPFKGEKHQWWKQEYAFFVSLKTYWSTVVLTLMWRTMHCLLLSYDGINAWKVRVSSFAFRRLLCMAAFDWSRNRNFHGQVFKQKKSTCSYKRIKAREALFLFVCVFLCLRTWSQTSVEREKLGRGKEKTPLWADVDYVV